MATTRTDDLGNLMLAGIREVFDSAAQNQRPAEYPQICREVVEEKLVGKYETVGSMGPATKHVEESAGVYDKIEVDNETTITSEVIEKKVKATLEAKIFDQYGVVESTFGAPLVELLVSYKEQAVADVWNGVFADTGADGVTLASSAHPLKNNNALYNDNLTRGALTVENIKTAKNMFNHIYTQSGMKFHTNPTHILIHKDKLYDIKELLESNLLAWELSNTVNSLQMIAPLQIIASSYLDISSTGVAPWFLLDKTIPKAGCVLQKKQGLTLKTWEDNDELSFKANAYEVYGVGMVAPGYGFVASPGS